jgi:hypothetical protein
MPWIRSQTSSFREFYVKEKKRGLIVVDRRSNTVALADFAFPFGRTSG